MLFRLKIRSFVTGPSSGEGNIIKHICLIMMSLSIVVGIIAAALFSDVLVGSDYSSFALTKRSYLLTVYWFVGGMI